MRIRMVLSRAALVVFLSAMSAPLFAINPESTDVPLPRVRMRAERINIDLRPLIEAVHRMRGFLPVATASWYDGRACAAIVTIRFYGAPKTEIIYRDRSYVIAQEGWIELVVVVRPMSPFFRRVRSALRLRRSDMFWLVRDSEREHHPIRALGAPDTETVASHDEQYFDTSGTMLILLR